jgi:hypothetical protein
MSLSTDKRAQSRKERLAHADERVARRRMTKTKTVKNMKLQKKTAWRMEMRLTNRKMMRISSSYSKRKRTT